MKDNSNAYAIVMAGGIGSRFWPLSRTQHPKQFHDILGTGESLLQATVRRLKRVLPLDHILVVTHRQYAPSVLEQLPMMAPENVIAEPMGRNTAPCITYALHKILALEPDAMVMVSPADHFIADEIHYELTVRRALEVGQAQQAIVTLGITPTRPDTGYGYIQIREEPGPDFWRVKTFMEKPSLEMAQTFLASGEFVWNSGMFFFPAQLMLAEIRHYQPDVAELFEGIEAVLGTAREAKKVEEAYARCPSISIDYAVMEKAQEVYVLRGDFGWSDLGTWASLYDRSLRDEAENAIHGQVLTYDASHNMVRLSDGKLGVIKGVDNLIIVETKDALLICPKDQEQEIREIVQDLRNGKLDAFL
ncbi:MAG: mannose-1-phosphate guanylyltransferase [Bacteroidetes bacterium]|jgi:mannose-1-phosphate guanylyltransferase|nr:mannose-1-phosphate guanylyltransferase [Bacteroidota bacterium]